MHNPIKHCKTCDRSRDCMRHMRAGHPPTAAEKWLRKTCVTANKPCEIVYTAGVDLAGLSAAIRRAQDKEPQP